MRTISFRSISSTTLLILQSLLDQFFEIVLRHFNFLRFIFTNNNCRLWRLLDQLSSFVLPKIDSVIFINTTVLYVVDNFIFNRSLLSLNLDDGWRAETSNFISAILKRQLIFTFILWPKHVVIWLKMGVFLFLRPYEVVSIFLLDWGVVFSLRPYDLVSKFLLQLGFFFLHHCLWIWRFNRLIIIFIAAVFTWPLNLFFLN